MPTGGPTKRLAHEEHGSGEAKGSVRNGWGKKENI